MQFVTRTSRGQRLFRVGLGFTVWIAVLSWMVQSGFLASQVWPRIMLFFALSNLVAAGAALSPVGRWFAQGIPLGALVLFQGFRFPLELILHDWAKQGVIPSTMSWGGSNFDIFSGALALLAGRRILTGHPNARVLAWVANGVGVVLLLNVMRVAVLSSPVPFGWGVEPPLFLALELPYAWIVPICVSGALFGHIVLTRALLSRTKKS